ncbi:hypothetical protein V5799_005693 [Amblyomma americanum]|uniref:Reverse transcriptase n=1 Tax=Amblyomma americanum TaxID=6943 RepID=A0AAQ4DYI3_AMBAM
MRWSIEGTSLLSGKEFVNVMKLRFNALPCLSRTKRCRDVVKQCRAGCLEDEVLGHVLQRCKRTNHARLRRHDVMVHYLARSLKEKDWNVREVPVFFTSFGRQIPDLVLKREGQAVILDVQVVGQRVDLEDAHAAKRAKYNNQDLHAQIADHPVIVMTALSRIVDAGPKAV